MLPPPERSPPAKGSANTHRGLVRWTQPVNKPRKMSLATSWPFLRHAKKG